jgi:hypothetical protein
VVLHQTKAFESETPPAAPDGSWSPARVGRLRACTAELFQQALTWMKSDAISIIASPMVHFKTTNSLLLIIIISHNPIFYFLLNIGKRLSTHCMLGEVPSNILHRWLIYWPIIRVRNQHKADLSHVFGKPQCLHIPTRTLGIPTPMML